MLSTWQVTEWHGGVERLGHVIAALKSCTHSYLLGTIILKPHFIPDTSSLLWKKQPSCEVSSSLKSKDPNQEFAKASNSQSFLQETNLSWPWCLKSLNPKLKWLASSLFCLPHLIFLKIERGRGKPWWIFFFFFCQPLVLFLWNISGFSLERKWCLPLLIFHKAMMRVRCNYGLPAFRVPRSPVSSREGPGC